ncbi:MAG TPA: N-acetylmuramoyl-L-alanine amidase [Polyangiaceae bacterium]|nr:N-acetylmuramoyl-L-alanine amidase [Polyangiaceae bacterium]
MGRIWYVVAALLGASTIAWVVLARTATTASWPAEDAMLTPPVVAFPAGFARRHVFIDPGHGAPDNTGNVSSRCEDEQDFTLSLALDLAARLEATGRFTVTSSRAPGELVRYRERVDAAAAADADVFLSLHSDVRGAAEPDRECPTSRDAPGFSVLWSDEGSAALTASRQALARHTAAALTSLGLTAYDGDEYTGLYEGDEVPGVFVDRHQPGKRIFVLREPTMPSVIIETHNAWDDREAARWEQEQTRAAFADAVAAALIAFFSDTPDRGPKISGG